VFRYFVEQPFDFATVYFDSESGSGYYTLLAQRQQLFHFNTQFIVGFQSLPNSELEKIEHKDHDFYLTEVSLLKQDYMQQKSLELAVIILFLKHFTWAHCQT
jgi:hypothetical protein